MLILKQGWPIRNSKQCRAIKHECRQSHFQNCNLGGEFALGSVTGPNPHLLPLSQLPNSMTPKCLHMDEHVRRVGTTGDKSVSLAAVEPLHRGFKGGAARLRCVAERFGYSRLRRGGRVVERQQL